MHILRNYTKYVIIVSLIFYVHCSDVIAYEAELDEGQVDQWLVFIRQRIDNIIAHLVILHVFFEGSKENNPLQLLLESLSKFDILGFNYTYYVICSNLR